LQLLVSVRSAAEVGAALDGGADIIDAKEPDRGSLGPVSPATLAQIFRSTPHTHPVSVALGDFAMPGQVESVFKELSLAPRTGLTYLKLGCAGAESPEVASIVLKTALLQAGRRLSHPHIVAVAYADAERTGSLAPDVVCRVAADAGVTGVLIDTHVKDGAGLLHWLSPSELAEWVEHAKGQGLLTGVAGSLGVADLESACLGLPDVVGFRGAACDGGRRGRVAADRVASLRRRLDRVWRSADRQEAWRNAGKWRVPDHLKRG
jgi:uncharacterized protein (UPF0264 family)